MILCFKNNDFSNSAVTYALSFFNLPPVFCSKIRSLQAFYIKGQRISIFSSVSPMTSVATTHICHYTVKAASLYVNELPGCVPKNFYL